MEIRELRLKSVTNNGNCLGATFCLNSLEIEITYYIKFNQEYMLFKVAKNEFITLNFENLKEYLTMFFNLTDKEIKLITLAIEGGCKQAMKKIKKYNEELNNVLYNELND